MVRTWRQTAAIDCGTTRIDPYLLWARVTDYASLGGRPAQDACWIPVLLELEGPVADLARQTPMALCEIPPVYLEPGPGLKASRFCTAKVSEGFFDPATNPWLQHVLRFEIGLPVVGSGRGAPRIGEGRDEPEEPKPIGPPVLAIIDDALPFLRFANGRWRWIDLWDQGIADGLHPDGLPYGTRLMGFGGVPHADVDAMGPYSESVWYDAFGVRMLRQRWSHGSAVFGLATFRSLPFDDDSEPTSLIGVHLPRTTWEDTSGLSLGVHVLDAMRFAIRSADDYADARRKPPSPIVANISYGRFAGAHDGSGLLSCALDELLELRNAERRPLAIVLPAGNGQLSRGHARIDALSPGATETLRWRVQPEDFTPSFVEVWFATSEGDHIRLHVTSPDGQTGTVSAGECAVLDEGGAIVASSAMYRKSAAGDSVMALIALQPTAALDPTCAVAPSGTWTIRIENAGSVPLTADAWIQRDDVFGPSRLKGRQSRFDDPAYVRFDTRGCRLDVDPAGTPALVRRTNTINPIATGRHTVVVGACVAETGRPSRYSASGSSGTAGTAGRLPDAMAVSDRSASLGGIPTAGVSTGTVVTAAGSSLAAPQVARWLVDRLADPHGPVPSTDPGWAREWVRTAFPAATSQQALRREEQGPRTMTADADATRGEAAFVPAPVNDPRGIWR